MRQTGMVTRLLPASSAVILLCAAAYAQTIVDPGRIAEIQRSFDSAVRAQSFRCRIDPVRPAIDYALRFRTGYLVDFPLLQFTGSGHRLHTLLRVLPDGQKPVYLETTGELPAAPATRMDAEMAGTFVVGEGVYDVEALVEDESQRVCRNRWRIQAKRNGSERELAPSTAPGAVEELNVTSAGAVKGTGRITILVHAAPLSQRTSTLQDSDVSALVGSLYSLLRQLPAESVRVVVFNLSQHSAPFRQDGFTTKDLDKVVGAMTELELAKVDYRILQQGPADLVANLLQTELHDPKPADAVILLGPRLQLRDDIPIPSVERASASVPALFYLQFWTQLPFPGGPLGAPPQSAGRRNSVSSSSGGAATFPSGTSDPLERLIGRLKGKVFEVRAPHELADNIRHMQTAMGRAPGTSLPSESSSEAPPARRPAAVDPQPEEGPLDFSKLDKLPKSEPDVDPVELLMRLRDRVLEHAVQLPKHTCVETIERQRFEPAAGRSGKSCDNILASRQQQTFQSRLRLDTTDRLRLDVAIAPEHEIFSWAGAAKFDEREIDELIPHGAIGTGSFASFLLATFADRSPQFIYEGDRNDGGRTMMEYSFSVAREDSHYRVKAGREWVITGYSGTLLVDIKTAELVRLTVRTEELPSETSECETDTSLDYGTIQLGKGDYLLPTVARQRFIGRDGSEDENVTTFSACRAFQAESTLSFAGMPGAPLPSSVTPPALDLPQGLPVTVEVNSPIDASRSAAGDHIEGRLTKAIRDGQKTLVAEGAMVHGRLMRVETRHSMPPEYTAALRWETIEIDGTNSPVLLRPDRRSPNLGAIGRGLRQRGMTIELPLPGEGSYGVYHSRTAVWEEHLKTEWLTFRP